MSAFRPNFLLKFTTVIIFSDVNYMWGVEIVAIWQHFGHGWMHPSQAEIASRSCSEWSVYRIFLFRTEHRLDYPTPYRKSKRYERSTAGIAFVGIRTVRIGTIRIALVKIVTASPNPGWRIRNYITNTKSSVGGVAGSARSPDPQC